MENIKKMIEKLAEINEVLKSDVDRKKKAEELRELSTWLDALEIEGSDLFVQTIKESVSDEARCLAVQVEMGIADNIEDDLKEVGLNIEDLTSAYIEQVVAYLESWCKDRVYDGKNVEDAIKELANDSETDNCNRYNFKAFTSRDLQYLVENELVDLEGSMNEGPTVKQAYELSKKCPLFIYAGDITVEEEEKARLAINSIYVPNLLNGFMNMPYEEYLQIKKEFFEIGVTSDAFYFGMSSFPMYEKFAKEDIRIKFRQYDMKFYEKLERYNSNIVENIIGFGGDLFIADTYFRLDEVLHCIRDIYNYYNQCDEISKVYFGDFIGIDYIIYSSITRLYSCYDKIAKYMKRIYKEYEKIKYFEDCGKITSSNIIQRKINSIIKNEYYCYLQEVRNMIYHNLRAGIIFGENTNRYYINLLTQIILENELLLFEFLEDIKPIKKGKIERNAPCPCGSGKKYKKCHGRYLSFRRM